MYHQSVYTTSCLKTGSFVVLFFAHCYMTVIKQFSLSLSLSLSLCVCVCMCACALSNVILRYLTVLFELTPL